AADGADGADAGASADAAAADAGAGTRAHGAETDDAAAADADVEDAADASAAAGAAGATNPGTGDEADVDAGSTEATHTDRSQDCGDARRAGAPGAAAAADGDGSGSGVCGACGGGLRLAGAHGRPVTVNVTIPLSTLLGLDDHPGELDGYGPIPAHIARHLSTAGLWRWVATHDTTGVVLDHGRTRYKPTQDLIDHVILRDRTCRAPGCNAPAQKCELDHSIYWPLGPTAACNL